MDRQQYKAGWRKLRDFKGISYSTMERRVGAPVVASHKMRSMAFSGWCDAGREEAFKRRVSLYLSKRKATE